MTSPENTQKVRFGNNSLSLKDLEKNSTLNLIKTDISSPSTLCSQKNLPAETKDNFDTESLQFCSFSPRFFKKAIP